MSKTLRVVDQTGACTCTLTEIAELSFANTILEERGEYLSSLYAASTMLLGQPITAGDPGILDCFKRAVNACEPYIPEQAREDLVDSIGNGYAANKLREVAKLLSLTEDQTSKMQLFIASLEEGGMYVEG